VKSFQFLPRIRRKSQTYILERREENRRYYVNVVAEITHFRPHQSLKRMVLGIMDKCCVGLEPIFPSIRHGRRGDNLTRGYNLSHESPRGRYSLATMLKTAETKDRDYTDQMIWVSACECVSASNAFHQAPKFCRGETDSSLCRMAFESQLFFVCSVVTTRVAGFLHNPTKRILRTQ
jgi:hypothetical protein